MAWGLEARVPFLDKEFLEVSLNIKPEAKLFGKGAQEQRDAEDRPIMEKYILRKAFDISPDGGRVRSRFTSLLLSDAHEIDAAALSPGLDSVATKGAILRWYISFSPRSLAVRSADIVCV